MTVDLSYIDEQSRFSARLLIGGLFSKDIPSPVDFKINCQHSHYSGSDLGIVDLLWATEDIVLIVNLADAAGVIVILQYEYKDGNYQKKGTHTFRSTEDAEAIQLIHNYLQNMFSSNSA